MRIVTDEQCKKLLEALAPFHNAYQRVMFFNDEWVETCTDDTPVQLVLEDGEILEELFADKNESEGAEPSKLLVLGNLGMMSEIYTELRDLEASEAVAEDTSDGK